MTQRGERTKEGRKAAARIAGLHSVFFPLTLAPSLPSVPASLREIESSLSSELAVSSLTMLARRTRWEDFVVQRIEPAKRSASCAERKRSISPTHDAGRLPLLPRYSLCALWLRIDVRTLSHYTYVAATDAVRVPKLVCNTIMQTCSNSMKTYDATMQVYNASMQICIVMMQVCIASTQACMIPTQV